ncbi:RNA 2',3'-cyclic phosphodiesterase [Desulfovibrio sp. UCD-KL4C]|uniref:RNA 2',3'-cyclic phosphodiesterase n=1 Tax=Desulfovibrio sp. UCD-KL4C TaxID=2578120 RepID=UPI0025BC619B|nr:RNA 2',3'-cyclic phosphodiesterase [Desulfovibrio sp. UCD-KL4C]
MQKIRTFIAHPVPEKWKKALSDKAEMLNHNLQSKVAWVKPVNMHFTLKFLGDISETDILLIDSVLKQIQFKPFKVNVGPGGFFPDPIKPRITWLGLTNGSKEICENAIAIDDGLEHLGFDKKTTPYHAHLTLGRIKKQAKDNWLELAEKVSGISLPECTIAEMVLYQSELTPEGPIYTKLKTYTQNG